MDYSIDNHLSVEFASLKFNNPLLLASGFLGISQNIFTRLHRLGLAGLVSKSISIDPREGYSGPTVVSLGNNSYLNAVGLSNPGVDYFVNEIKNNKTPLIISLVGSHEKEFLQLVSKFDSLNILGYEINLSCPHVEKMGIEVGDDPDLVSRIIKSVKSITSKPVIIKVGIGNSDIVKTAEIAKDSGADAITAINTIRAMTINIETGMPVLSNKIGGLSGTSIKPIAIRCVYEIYKKIDIPIIGCGGISSWEDVLEFMFAGASATQLGSVLGSKTSFHIFSQILNGLISYLDRKNIKNIQEIIGSATKY